MLPRGSCRVDSGTSVNRNHYRNCLEDFWDNKGKPDTDRIDVHHNIYATALWLQIFEPNFSAQAFHHRREMVKCLIEKVENVFKTWTNKTESANITPRYIPLRSSMFCTEVCAWTRFHFVPFRRRHIRPGYQTVWQTSWKCWIASQKSTVYKTMTTVIASTAFLSFLNSLRASVDHNRIWYCYQKNRDDPGSFLRTEQIQSYCYP